LDIADPVGAAVRQRHDVIGVIMLPKNLPTVCASAALLIEQRQYLKCRVASLGGTLARSVVSPIRTSENGVIRCPVSVGLLLLVGV
jgi:hypothetical protein